MAERKAWELEQLQALPLEIKIRKTQIRIREFYEYYGGQVYISFSGGKDSTVLLDIARKMYPDIEAVFVDTGLEYPEVKEFVKTVDNVTRLRPKMNFKQVLDYYGYPVISKEQSKYIREYRTSKSDKVKDIRWNGNKWGQGKISNKWKFLVDAPFKIDERCCDVMKKRPAHKFEKESGKKCILGTMTEESSQRKTSWLRNGCNAFDGKRPLSKPMSFWTEQDVLLYLKKYNIPYATAYGDIVEDEAGKLKTTLCERTGCIWCPLGCQHDDFPNRFQRLKQTHPQLYDYCINKLDLKQVLEYINVPYE